MFRWNRKARSAAEPLNRHHSSVKSFVRGLSALLYEPQFDVEFWLLDAASIPYSVDVSVYNADGSEYAIGLFHPLSYALGSR